MPLFRRRRPDEGSAMPALATRLGLTYRAAGDADVDVEHLPDLPLFREGTQGTVTHEMVGTIDDVDVRIFTFDAADQETAEGQRSCVLLTFEGVVFPELYLAPRDRLPRLGETLQEAGVSIDSTRLMARFRIQARTRQAASSIIDAAVEDWLIDCPVPGVRIELRGGALLGHVPALLGPDDLAALLDFVVGLYQRIPERAWASYRAL